MDGAAGAIAAPAESAVAASTGDIAQQAIAHMHALASNRSISPPVIFLIYRVES